MSTSNTPTPNSVDFSHVDTVRDPDGPVAIITERNKDGRVTFSLMKEFDRGGKTERTPYFHRSHIPALRRLIDDLEEKLEVVEDRTRAKHRDQRRDGGRRTA